MSTSAPMQPQISFDHLPPAEQEKVKGQFAEWSLKFNEEIEAAISRSLQLVGISGLTFENIKPQALRFFFGGSVAAALAGGVSIGELKHTLALIEEAQKDAEADTDPAPAG